MISSIKNGLTGICPSTHLKHYDICGSLVSWLPRNSSSSLRGQLMWSNSVDVSCSFPVSMVRSSTESTLYVSLPLFVCHVWTSWLILYPKHLLKDFTLGSKWYLKIAPLEKRLCLCRQLNDLTQSLGVFQLFGGFKKTSCQATRYIGLSIQDSPVCSEIHRICPQSNNLTN